jgi:hypothetical protein
VSKISSSLIRSLYAFSCLITDAEEFLKEIQREEAAKAAQLKLEIKEEQLRLLEEEKLKTKKKTTKKKKKKTKAKSST